MGPPAGLQYPIGDSHGISSDSVGARSDPSHCDLGMCLVAVPSSDYRDQVSVRNPQREEIASAASAIRSTSHNQASQYDVRVGRRLRERMGDAGDLLWTASLWRITLSMS